MGALSPPFRGAIRGSQVTEIIVQPNATSPARHTIHHDRDSQPTLVRSLDARSFWIGLTAARKPSLALLDEVHTYDGATGAQAALTLRRRPGTACHADDRAGLQLLANAARFFSRFLYWVAVDNVVEITPTLEELEEKGAEYPDRAAIRLRARRCYQPRSRHQCYWLAAGPARGKELVGGFW